MSIKDLYTSGFRDRNRGHFASIVRVALSDGEIVAEEKVFLDRIASRLDITEMEYKAILENPKTYPINPPTTYSRRLERLFDLTRMVFVDMDVKENQIEVLERMAVGLGFSPENTNYVVHKALALIVEGVDDVDDFASEIKNMNR
jgi:uncharacterized tellurite resistance protein B-like protein